MLACQWLPKVCDGNMKVIAPLGGLAAAPALLMFRYFSVIRLPAYRNR